MSQVLYQKYRPINFDQVVGQDCVIQVLKNSVSKNKISHAYIFVGPRGTGKTSVARILSKAINAPLKDGNPDSGSEIVKAIENGSLLDLIEIDAASNRGIDEIRALKEKANFLPVQAKYKIYIIDEVHMMTKEAFNALLKTLEEPPAHVVFILATTEVHKVPLTILSRCMRFDFKLGSKEEILRNIKKILEEEKCTMEDAGLELLYDASGGSYRDSLSVLEVVMGSREASSDGKFSAEEVRRILGLPDQKIVLDFLEKVVMGDLAKAVDLIQEVSTKGMDLHQFVNSSVEILRKILVSKMKEEKIDGEIAQIDNLLTMQKLVDLVSLFVGADNEIKTAAIPTLPIEIAIARFVQSDEKYEGKGKNDKKTAPQNIGPKDEGTEKILISKKEANKDSSVSENLAENLSTQLKNKEVIRKNNAEVKAITLQSIKNKWSNYLTLLKDKSGLFQTFLSKAHVLNVTDSVILLGVPFAFHKERIDDPVNKNMLSELAKKIWGVACRIECIVREDLQQISYASNNESIISSQKEPRVAYKKIDTNFIDANADIDPSIMQEVLDVFV